MELGNILRIAVDIIDDVTGGPDGIQDTITLYPWVSDDTYGKPVPGAGVPIEAIIFEKQMRRRLGGGQEVVQKASIIIPRPVAANGASGRKEPIDPRDKIVLSNGYTGPILSVEGPNDRATHAPFVYEIILG